MIYIISYREHLRKINKILCKSKENGEDYRIKNSVTLRVKLEYVFNKKFHLATLQCLSCGNDITFVYKTKIELILAKILFKRYYNEDKYGVL